MNKTLLLEIVRVRRVWLIVIGGLLVINAALYLYLFLVQEPRTAVLQDKLLAVRRANVGRVAQDPGSIYQRGTADLLAWRNRMPAKREFARFIGDLFEIARTNSLTMGSITYKPTTIKGEPILTYGISFSVAGKYPQVKSFIADVSNLHSIAVIDNISLNNSRMTEEYVDLKLELTTYFRLEGQ